MVTPAATNTIQGMRTRNPIPVSSRSPLPMVLPSMSGSPRTSTPPVMSWAPPSAMPSVPSVTISAGMRPLAISAPFSSPQPRPTASAASRPSRSGARDASSSTSSTTPPSPGSPSVSVSVRTLARSGRRSAESAMLTPPPCPTGGYRSAARAPRTPGRVRDRSGHRADEILHRRLRGLEGGHPAAEPEHLDPVRDLEHLGHVVADQHDRQSLVAHAPDEVEHLAGGHHPERRGRLVQEQHLAGPGDRPRHRHALALAPGEALDRRGRALHPDAEALEGVAGLPAHRLVVEQAEPAEHPAADLLPAKEEVGGGVEVRGQGEVLVDGLDPDRARGDRARQRDPATLEADLAPVGLQRAGQDLDQGRLARAVVADQGDHLPGGGGEVGPTQRADVPEALHDAARLQQWLAHPALLSSSALTASGRGTAATPGYRPAAHPAARAAPRAPASTTGG